jgi:hypothetical protein
VVLIGGALLAGFGSQGAQAAGNPFNEILAKLDQILTALGGLSQGNPTLRWDQALPGAQRFAILAAFNNDAVLDKNTGLVWEKSPATTTTTWAGATGTCINKNVGGQKGWRLPAIAEQASLVDPSVAPPGPTLPPGHPFLNVQSAFYWSASTEADNPARAWLVDFFDGDVVNGNKINSLRVWCVRGPMQESVY